MEQDGTANQQEDQTEDQPHKHSKVISGYWTQDGKLHWRYATRNLEPHEDENIEVRFFILIKDTPTPQKGDAVKKLLKSMQGTEVSWLAPDRREWIFHLDQMRDKFPDLQELEWCRGKAFVEPDFEVKKERSHFGRSEYFETSVVFYINPEVLTMQPIHIAPPIEIQQSLQQFRLDHPDSNKVAFVMMKFEQLPAHDNIVNGIKAALTSHGISAVRADDKEYHTDLYYNILTYLHGCGFGIAVFERIEREDFNPNVSLEVGYLLALRKHVCLLKDKTLSNLHTDLVGKLYRPFNPQDPIASIPPELSNWLKDRGIVF